MEGPTRRRPGRPAGQGGGSEEETRAAIVRAAAGLFHRRGYAAVAIGEIASAVGVTKPTLYYHFSGKDAIYAASVTWTLGQIGAGVAALARAPGPIRDRLLELSRQSVIHSPPEANLDQIMRDVAEHLTPEQQAAVHTAHEAMLGAFDDLMRSGIAAGELRPAEPRILTHAYLHLLDAFTHAPTTPLRDDDEAIATTVELFLDGAAVRG
jgi:AcrR family transcriptional regulator